MTVSDTLQAQALELASSDIDREDAISALTEASLGRRVAVVRAKQDLEGRAEPTGAVADAIGLLDDVLTRGTWT
jgi:hypothetical protein